MYFVLFWLLGGFIGFICMLKLSKSRCGVGNFSCSDIVCYSFLSLLGGPLTIISAGSVWFIENLSKLDNSSGWCKKLTTFINKHI